MTQNEHESLIVQLLTNAQEDLEWYENNLDSIKKKYDGKFIAIIDK